MFLQLPEKSKEKVVWPRVVHTVETKFKITAKFETYKWAVVIRLEHEALFTTVRTTYVTHI